VIAGDEIGEIYNCVIEDICGGHIREIQGGIIRNIYGGRIDHIRGGEISTIHADADIGEIGPRARVLVGHRKKRK
jgi:hypothetical protein